MRASTLADLDLKEHVDDVVGTALLARTTAMQVFRMEGPTARMQDMAALALGSMALVDVEVTRRAAVGLVATLTGVPSALGPTAAGIAAAAAEGWPREDWGSLRMEPPTPERLTVDWAVFLAMQSASL